MRFVNKAVAAAGLGFTVSAVVGCGSSGDLLSSAQAAALRTQLSRASAALQNGQCGSAAGYISNFQTRVDDLGSVNQTLVNNLQAGATKIENLAAKECPTNTTPTPQPVRTTPRRHTTPQNTTTTNTATTNTATTNTATTAPTTTSTPTQTGTGTNATNTGTGTISTQTGTSPIGGLTGPSTTSSTPAPPPSSGGGGLSGGGLQNGQRRSGALPPGWQRRQAEPGAVGWHGGGYGQGNGYGDAYGRQPAARWQLGGRA